MAKAIPNRESERYLPLIRNLSRFVEWPFNAEAVTKGKAKLTPRDKAFITQRHKEVYGYTGPDGHWHSGLNDDGLEFYAVKPQIRTNRNGKKVTHYTRRLALQTTVHQRYVGKHYKGAFILTAGQRSKVRWNGNRPIIDLETVSLRYIDFDQRRLMKNPRAEVKRATEATPDAKSFKIQCGEHSSAGAWTKEHVAEKVIEWMNTYQQGGEKYKKYNHYKRWMGGLIAFNFRNQKSFKSYINDKKKHATAKLAKNRAARKARIAFKKGSR